MLRACFRVAFICSFMSVVNSLAFAQEQAATESSTQGAEDFLRSYTVAFGEGDAGKLAAFWTADAEWESTATGAASNGRDEITADFQAFFDENPGAKLNGTIDSIKEVAPGVVCLDGQTTLMLPDAEPRHGGFHAVLTSSDGKWQLAKVVESAPPLLEDTTGKLEPLSFFVGQWQDQGDGPAVNTTVRWGANQTFLIRSFTIDDEEQTSQGTQVIGWDPIENCVRSWSFFSDGSFGGGTWTHSDNEWNGRLWQTLVDGSACSGTQVIRIVDNDTLEVENIGQEIDGEPLPSQPAVRVVRVADEYTAVDASEEE